MDAVDPVIVTKEDLVLSYHEIRLDDISLCSHEEADTGMFVHMQVMQYRKATKSFYMIKANDTDVVIIAIASYPPSWQELGLQKLWVAFSQGSHLIWIQIHDIVTTIGPE